MTAETHASSNGDASSSSLVHPPTAVMPACNPNRGVIKEDTEENSYVFVASKDHALIDGVEDDVNACPVKSCVDFPNAASDDSNAGPVKSCVDFPNAASDDSNASPVKSCVDLPNAVSDDSNASLVKPCVYLPNAASDDSNASPIKSCVDLPNATSDDSNASPVKSCVDLPNAASDDSNASPVKSCGDLLNAASDDSNASPVKSCVDLPNAANDLIDDSNSNATNDAANDLIGNSSSTAHESHVDLHGGITAAIGSLEKVVGQDSFTATATVDLPCAITRNGSLDSESAQVSASAGPQPVDADQVAQAESESSEPDATNPQNDDSDENGNPPLHQHNDHHDTHSPKQDNSQVQHSILELAPNGLQSDSTVSVDVRESSDAREEDSVSVGSKSSEVDVCQSYSNLQNDDTNGPPSATEAIHQNGTIEESEFVDPGIVLNSSSAAVHEVPAFLLKSEVDLVRSAEPDSAVASDVTEASDACHEPQQDNLVPVTSESSEADVSQSSIDQQNHRISDESLGSEESENAHSDDTHSESQQAEVLTHPVSLPEGPTNLEELDSSQFDKSEERIEEEAKAEVQTHPFSLSEGGPTHLEELDSSQFDKSEERNEEETKAEVQTHPFSLSEGGPTNLEELESSQFGKSEQRTEEEATAELLPEAGENQQTAVVIADNCMSNMDQESKAEQSVDLIASTGTAADTVVSHEKGHLPVPGAQDMKELSENHDGGEKPSELEAHGDTSSVAPNCLKKETDNAEDKCQHENSSLTNDVDEVSHSETEDMGFSIQGVGEFPREIETEFEATAQDEIAVVDEDKVAELKTGHETETEFEATAQDETLVVNEDGAFELETGHVGAVSDSSPLSNERGEEGVMLSEAVCANDLGNGINTCPTDFANIEFGSLSYQVPSVKNDACEADILVVESSNTQFAPSHAEIKPEVEDVNSSGRDCDDMTSDTALASKLEISDSSIVTEKIVPNSIPEINGVEVEGDQMTVLNVQDNDKPVVGKESEMVETPHSEESSTSVVESSTSGSLAGQDVDASLLISPIQYWIRVPRFDELKDREQKKQAQVQLQIDEKTKIRDAFRHECQKLEANRHGHAAECKAAKSNAKYCKELVRSKRKEIDSLQDVLNKVKNAMSINDINALIKRWEYRMQHETMPLTEEKQGIREIKQLKQHRQQLSSSIGNKNEVPVNEREEIEGRLKVLKKELDRLKDDYIKAEAVVQAAQKKYDDETRKLREVQKKRDEANDARQSAFSYLQSLKKELYEKNKPFYKFKDAASAARVPDVRRDREALHHICRNQVKSFMEAWNDDEFRKEYVKSNMKKTANRLGTLDGRSLSADEEPPVLPSFVVERPDRLIANQRNSSSVVHTPSPKLVDQTKTVVSIDDPNTAQDGEAKNQTVKNRGVVNHSMTCAPPSSVKETKDEIISEAEYIPTKEELELERKVKEEEAAKLKEQRRVEEISKAHEALERKKKNAEKAQQRAELRAQREAEQREKEREKRIRKKEKKKASGSEIQESEEACNPTGAETVKESKRPQKASAVSKQSKAKSNIPPPLRNRNKKKMQQWMWVSVTCVLVIFLFVLGNVGFFSNLSNLRPRKNTSF